MLSECAAGTGEASGIGAAAGSGVASGIGAAAGRGIAAGIGARDTGWSAVLAINGLQAGLHKELG
jgi:hypothetical protein